MGSNSAFGSQLFLSPIKIKDPTYKRSPPSVALKISRLLELFESPYKLQIDWISLALSPYLETSTCRVTYCTTALDISYDGNFFVRE